MNQQVLLKVFSVHGRETTGLASVGFLSFRHRSHLNQVVELYQLAKLLDTEIIIQHVWKSEIICSIRNSPFLAKLSLQDMNMLSNTLSMFGLVVPYQCSLNHKINHANLIFWNLPPMLSPSIYFTCCQVPNSTLLYWPSTCSTNHHHYIANS